MPTCLCSLKWSCSHTCFIFALLKRRYTLLLQAGHGSTYIAILATEGNWFVFLDHRSGRSCFAEMPIPANSCHGVTCMVAHLVTFGFGFVLDVILAILLCFEHFGFICHTLNSLRFAFWRIGFGFGFALLWFAQPRMKPDWGTSRWEWSIRVEDVEMTPTMCITHLPNDSHVCQEQSQHRCDWNV